MRYLRSLAVVAAIFSIFLLAPAPKANAQVVLGYGAPYGPPSCAYGYYNYAPYACAPYGYYGPEWFSGGLFIGAGPWYHGGYYGRGYGYGYRGGVGYYGRGGYGYGRPGYGGYGSGYHGGFHGGAYGGGGFHGGGYSGGGFHGGGGGGFHGGGGGHR
jgi:hypothetical protein